MSFFFLCQESAPAATSQPTLPSYDLKGMVILLAVMGIAPFLLAMVTSFARFVIIGGLLRQALGLNQIPPNSVLTGIAMILTIHVMSPVIDDAWRGLSTASTEVEKVRAVLDPLDRFMKGVVPESSLARYERDTATELPTSVDPNEILRRDAMRCLTVTVPAFVMHELQCAFWTGFWLFLPFLIIDLIVGNILLALGMQMMSPTTISLPLKLLLFVVVDGWSLVFAGIIGQYGGAS